MVEKAKVEAIMQRQGYADFRWIGGKDIVTAQWVRMKCAFGCGSYGKKGTCPPNTPPLTDCRQFFIEYDHIVILHFEKKVDKPEDRFEWSKEVNRKLLDLEREVFLSGFHKAFLLFMDECEQCNDCSGLRESCKNPSMSRPNPESLCMDVFSTIRRQGYPIEVLSDYTKTMNRYAFLLVE
ncbi:MAG: DUF2284 domain-containing protein [Deltaproteobacteria bacterium]|nr:DUF2284 domain-containing protein [Deltaproteobacteria bacterium]